jgi:hypothetical protein
VKRTLITTREAALALGTTEHAVILLGMRGRLTRYGSRGRAGQRWDVVEVTTIHREWSLAISDCA